jgi:peptidoglycan/xylan/chitin deacetylase (PgdA/CDA1 family)
LPLLRQRMALSLRIARRRLRSALAPRAIVKTVAGLVALCVIRPIRDLVRTLTGSHPLHVFNFHRITTLCRDGMTVSPRVLERQVAYIARTHDIVSLEEALDLVRNGRRLRRPVALLTFDDGYRSVFNVARPILKAHRVPGCCFVCPDFVGTNRRFAHDETSPVRSQLEVMTWNELAVLLEEGWAVGSHTASHARLSECRGDELRHEVEGAGRILKERFGREQLVIAYPFGQRGDISAEAREFIRKVGYAACFNDASGENRVPCDSFDITRIEIGGHHPTLAWKLRAHGLSLERFATWKRWRALATEPVPAGSP